MITEAERPNRLPAIERMRDAAARSRGATDPDVRTSAREGSPVPAPLGPYLEKVRAAAWTITDEDVAGLRAAGWSEESLVELTIAAAMGEAGRRHDAVLRALRPED
jgi:hypothetical protein